MTTQRLQLPPAKDPNAVQCTKTDADLILLLKAPHESTKAERKALEELYMKVYMMDTPYPSGIRGYVTTVFRKIWEARGGRFDDIMKVSEEALPSQVWKVGGDVSTTVSHSFTETQIVWFQILSMCSYIRLTEVKYLSGHFPR